MHHTVKPEEIKAQRDGFFAEYWDKELEFCEYPSSPLVPVVRSASEEAFNRGFAHGMVIGAEHAAKMTTAVMANDIAELFGIELPESKS